MSEQSFSYKLKDELLTKINSRAKADVCLMGMLTFCNTLCDSEIVFLTGHRGAALFFALNCARVCLGRDIESLEDAAEVVSVSKSVKKDGTTLYKIEVTGDEDRLTLLSYFRMDNSRRLTPDDLPKAKYYPQLIAGIFLSCGSLNDPEKKYHLEFVMPNIQLCNDFGLLLLENYGILAKQTERKNSQIVYIKESENIIDLLTVMGATGSSLELMNIKILKDIRNKINRAVNCDNANIEKTLKAAEKQVEDIELIDATVGIDSLPEALQEIARLRYENPDISLKELGTMLKPPISRSGVNHRLVRLSETADRIRKEKH
ncbi:MAG: DNA-binding protein WhiA [Ruminococcus sp.]|nr:DNA-binding protein WhiA [Ruminococcus sp.]